MIYDKLPNAFLGVDVVVVRTNNLMRMNDPLDEVFKVGYVAGDDDRIEVVTHYVT